MVLRYWLTFWVSWLTIAALGAQPLDSVGQQTAPPAAPAQVTDYRLQARAGDLVVLAEGYRGPGLIDINGEMVLMDFASGEAVYELEIDHKGRLLLLSTSSGQKLYHVATLKSGNLRLRRIPFWLSIIPPLLAIGLALIFREVVVSLFAGVWAGAFIAGGLRIESLYYFLQSLFSVVSEYILEALTDGGHISVIVFSLLIGGMVAIISRNGGMAGVVRRLSKYARTDRSAQFITWLLGVAIFFDDYANTLIVGNTMRSVTDRFNISREKLAYIVDSTAAPVAAVAFITTWIGAELGYIGDGMELISGFPGNPSPYAIFIESLKYSFYPIMTLIFILYLIRTGRDFGPMLQSERRARSTGQVSPLQGQGDVAEETEDLSPVPGAPLRARNAVLPVLVVILGTFYGLLDTGIDAVYQALVDAGNAPAGYSWSAVWAAMPQEGFFLKMGDIIGSADSYQALLWSSVSGVIVAVLMTLLGRIMSLERTMGTLATGFKTMLPALMILTLAWSLAATTETLYTANFLTQALQDAVNVHFLPGIVFVLAALISFSTGSSWSTMAILYPLAIPITWALAQSQGVDLDHSTELLYNVIATVLAASVLGDHCSPISDTTILSSLASDCNHIDHVRTQLPYALTVGGVSLVLCVLSTYFDGAWGLSLVLLAIGLAILFAVVRFVGRPVTVEVEEN